MTPQRYRVRQMRPSEKDETHLLMDELGFAGDWFPVHRTFVALWDGEVVGFGVIERRGRTGTLTMAGVRRDHRGRGLQRRLIRARLRWARQKGLTRVTTYVHRGNWRSMNNLIRCGFLVRRPNLSEFVNFVRDLRPKEN